uniref:Uncharacterized protein n=1 Tax=Pseudobryopsis hainanensis TaxID=2320808 RepID=A0A3S7SZW7_9CHLO|nr:hypothetical protein [Pseudobryopsis hainanensis]
MFELKFNPINRNSSIALYCQPFRFNRFRFQHSLELQTENPDTLFGLVHFVDYIPGRGVAGPDEAQVELKLDHSHAFSTSVNYQISDHACIFLKAKMVNVGALEYATGPISYWQYSNWSHRVLSVGYNYKHFQVEYTIHSEFSEPKLQVFMGLDVPGWYFKDMLSGRYTHPKTKSKEVKTMDSLAANAEMVQVEPLTSPTIVVDPELKSQSHQISTTDQEISSSLEINEVKQLNSDLSQETTQDLSGNSSLPLESQPILVLSSVDQTVSPMNAQVEEEGSVAETTCNPYKEIEEKALIQSEAVPPASLASTAHSSGPIGMGQALAAGVLFLGCTSLVVGHIWHRLNKVFNA